MCYRQAGHFPPLFLKLIRCAVKNYNCDIHKACHYFQLRLACEAVLKRQQIKLCCDWPRIQAAWRRCSNTNQACCWLAKLLSDSIATRLVYCRTCIDAVNIWIPVLWRLFKIKNKYALLRKINTCSQCIRQGLPKLRYVCDPSHF